MPKRIGGSRVPRIYLAEWRELRDLTQERLGERLGVSGMTVSRWERRSRALNLVTLAAIAEALNIAPEDIYRPPGAISADALLRDQPEAIRRQAIAIIETLRKTGS